MSDSVRFLLDGKIREVKDVEPTRTLLSYLRYDLQKTGSKEGCGEGDCGACTVVIGERTGEDITYRTVNACILFLPTLHGRELLTVESLRGEDGALHPVQQALVDHHGSQCGFCTPGIVMSLYALYLSHKEPPDLEEINQALAGNLCRCTGYGPIITAAQKMRDYPAPRPETSLADRVRLLKSLESATTFSLTGAGSYFAPMTKDDLARLVMEYPAATLLAGGTDVGLMVTKQHRDLGVLIYLGNVRELQQIAERDGNLHIGAGVTYARAIDHIARHYPDFGAIIRRIGATQVRNQGTIGGNIANGSPIGDSPPCLIALGAGLKLRRGAESRIIDVEDYFLAYGKQDLRAGEFIEEIILPLPEENQQFIAYKISKRLDQDISALCMGMSFHQDGERQRDVRIAFGGMAEIPKRATSCEAALEGAIWQKSRIEQAMAALEKDFTPIDDMRASARYRMQVAKNLILKACMGAGHD